MKIITQYLKVFVVLIAIVIIAFSFFEFYPYIFSKTIVGKIDKVERIQVNVSLMQNEGNNNNKISPELFSFAVAIRTPDGSVHTASAEDRQWAAVSEGLCVTAKFFPYPPWKLEKSGTYYGARLLESHVCQ